MLTQADINAFRKQLIDLMRRVKSEVGVLRGEALQTTGGEASGSLSNLPFHQADLASREAEEDLTLDLIGNEEKLLAEMDAALTRIEQGSFGRCEDCQKPIVKERLHAVPYARTCLSCAERREAKPTA